MSSDPLNFLDSLGSSGAPSPAPIPRSAPPKKPKSAAPLALAIGFVVAIVLCVWFIVATISRDFRRAVSSTEALLSAKPEKNQSKSSPEEIATVRANATRLMKIAQANGIIGDCKLHDADFCEAYVMPPFYQMDFDLKKQTAAAVWSWAFTGKNHDGILLLTDSVSGKEVGEFSIAGGGLSMK